MENGLSIVEDPKSHGKSYNKWLGNQAKPSHREQLRMVIDRALEQKPADFDGLLKLLTEMGCEVSRRGKAIQLKAPGWKNVARMDEKLGSSSKGGRPTKRKDALTDQQVSVLLDAVKGLPPYLFIMIGLYSGLCREEALGLQWDCVFLDAPTPYISVRRAWRSEHNRPVISTVLKTPAARRDIPIPKCLVDCLREAKEDSISEYVIADSKGEPLSYSQFQRVWQYVIVRSTKERTYYKYVNG